MTAGGTHVSMQGGFGLMGFMTVHADQNSVPVCAVHLLQPEKCQCSGPNSVQTLVSSFTNMDCQLSP